MHRDPGRGRDGTRASWCWLCARASRRGWPCLLLRDSRGWLVPRASRVGPLLLDYLLYSLYYFYYEKYETVEEVLEEAEPANYYYYYPFESAEGY